MIAVRI